MWFFDPLEQASYGTILADPPWDFRTYSKVGQGKSASQHYPVMGLKDLKQMPVDQLGLKDSVLVMWVTQAQADQGFELMKAWGYQFKSMGAWAKQSKTGTKWAFGTGYIYRSAAEFYLLGTTGAPKTAARNIRNLIVSPVRRHSEKPDEMHEQLERMYPDEPRCELFARARREKWSSWGDEITAETACPA